MTNKEYAEAVKRGDESLVKIVPEPDECNQCGNPGWGIALIEMEELLKTLDKAERVVGQLSKAGMNLTTKKRYGKHRTTLQTMRSDIRAQYAVSSMEQ